MFRLVERCVKLFGRKMFFAYLSINVIMLIFILYLICFIIARKDVQFIDGVVMTLVTAFSTVILASIGANAFITKQFRSTDDPITQQTIEKEEGKNDFKK